MLIGLGHIMLFWTRVLGGIGEDRERWSPKGKIRSFTRKGGVDTELGEKMHGHHHNPFNKKGCPLIDEWRKKMWSIYTIEYYSSIKKNDTLPFSKTRMNLAKLSSHYWMYFPVLHAS